MMRAYSICAALALCAGLMGVSAPAGAADLGSGGYKDAGAAPDEWAITGLKVGGILIVKPTYEGSDNYEVFGFPYIFPTFAGGPGFFSRIDAKGLDDIRFKLIDRGGFVAGPLGGYNLGRDEDDDDALDGLGNVDGGVVAGAFAGYRFGPVLLDVSFHNTFGDDGGYQIRFGAEAERPLSERFLLTARVGATYADDDYMSNYFGVSLGQSLSSGLPEYDAEAGFKDVHVELGLKAELDAHWSARASVRYSRLIGDAADSPIVESEDQVMGLIGLSYRFDLAR
jgi:outer membrane scaffolding protein for murein synthesis (MipA/OmpV family)